MEVVTAILDAQRRAAPVIALSSPEVSTRLVALLLQQAVEKIDRLRDRAFGLLHFLLCSKSTQKFDLGLAQRRACNLEAYDPVSLSSTAKTLDVEVGSAAWPPAHAEALRQAILGNVTSASSMTDKPDGEDKEDDSMAQDVDNNCDRFAVFDTFVPFLGYEVYRPAIVRGLVVSIGGITESTSKNGRNALYAYAQQNSSEQLCEEILRLFEQTPMKDVEPEARRFVAPLLQTAGLLLAQDMFPAAFAQSLHEKAFAAVRSSKDLVRLKASIAVFVGLLRWTGPVRRKALAVCLQFLGYSFPVVRQATAQALYIRLLAEDADFDLSPAPEGKPEADASKGAETGGFLIEL